MVQGETFDVYFEGVDASGAVASLGVSVCLSVCLFVCLPVCLSVCLSVHLSACLPVCIHLYVCQPVFLSVSVHPSVCLSVCQPSLSTQFSENGRSFTVCAAIQKKSKPQKVKSRSGLSSHVTQEVEEAGEEEDIQTPL